MKHKYSVTSIIVLLIGLILMVLFFFQIRNREQAVFESYTSLIENAIHGFSVYTNTQNPSDYWAAVSSYGAAVNSILTIGENTEIYKERHSLNAVYQVLLNYPQWGEAELDGLISALNVIAENPSQRTSYAQLLDFYNSFNYSK